jgi:pimeloyl-ACP methyl ester carboxylesterase
MDIHEVTLHGHKVRYRAAGSRGPVVVLLHGITCSLETWEPVFDRLARRARVIAPDLLGHGQSAKPRGDYSPGAYASGVRDLLALLGHDRVTIVGHSMGGGVALQFAYLFPERCERLVLVASGGLGREVSPMLRAATLPGAELVLPIICNRRLLDIGSVVARLVERSPVRVPSALREVARGYASLADARARAAFLHTLRVAIDHKGQRINAADRLYLAEELPALVVWGDRDAIIPSAHGQGAHDQMPGSRFELFERSGHFPHHDEPGRFVDVVEDFIASTRPASLTVETLRSRLVDGSSDARRQQILPDVATA